MFSYTKLISYVRIASFLLLPPFIIDAAEAHHTTIQSSPYPPITFSITNQPTAISNATATSINNLSTTIFEAVRDTLTHDNYENAKQALQTLLWEKRYKLGFITATATYLTIAGLLLHDYLVVYDRNAWCNWKSDVSMIELYNLDEKLVEKELLQAITAQYYDVDNPTIITQPLVAFLSAIEKEIQTLNRYLKVATTIEKIRLIKIFPTNIKKIATAQKMMERACFVKRIFLSWLSDYALQH